MFVHWTKLYGESGKTFDTYDKAYGDLVNQVGSIEHTESLLENGLAAIEQISEGEGIETLGWMA